MKKREQILLEPSQKKRLQDESDHTGVPKTEIVRRALDRYFNEKEIAITLMSEPALAKDWMRPEEDEAWSDL
jgi:predicted DNA-binding protein